jgi:hypothetical protein
MLFCLSFPAANPTPAIIRKRTTSKSGKASSFTPETIEKTGFTVNWIDGTFPRTSVKHCG